MRWSTAKKEKIRASRLESLELLIKTVDRLKNPPGRLFVTSAVGYYGDRGSKSLSASAPAGEGFLAGVCADLETRAKDSPIPCTIGRFGLVLSPNGGVLQQLLRPIRLGLGGIIGGDQYVSWIALDDLIYQIYVALALPAFEGTYNFCSPHCVTHRQFVETIADVCSRRARIHLSSKLVQRVLGEASALVLNSVRAEPDPAQLPFFIHSELKRALEHMLGKSPLISQ
jgi:hypothetical protein